MKQHWWKFTGILLLIYVIYNGLSIPLRPGFYKSISEEHQQLNTGVNSGIIVTGYNTQFAQDSLQELHLVLRSSGNPKKIKDTLRICAESVKALNDRQIQFDVSIPSTIPHHSLELFVLSKSNGILYLPQAFQVKGATIAASDFDDSSCQSIITNSKITPVLPKHFPNINILNETIRNLFFHVPLWFSMIILMLVALIASIGYLISSEKQLESTLLSRAIRWDILASKAVEVGVLFAIMGCATGSVWARFTWGSWWTSDPKLNGSAVTLLVYLAYLILRNSTQEESKRAKLSAVFNIFAFFMMIVFIIILPRLTDSLHPGNGGNPGFNSYDLDNNLRTYFYPAVFGWILLSVWILSLKIRTKKIEYRLEEN